MSRSNGNGRVVEAQLLLHQMCGIAGNLPLDFHNSPASRLAAKTQVQAWMEGMTERSELRSAIDRLTARTQLLFSIRPPVDVCEAADWILHRVGDELLGKKFAATQGGDSKLAKQLARQHTIFTRGIRMARGEIITETDDRNGRRQVHALSGVHA